MKPLVLIYCADDGPGAKALAASLRDGKSNVLLCAASGFTGIADPRCVQAYVAPDVPAWRRKLIVTAYGSRASQPPPAKAPPPAAEIAVYPVTIRHRGFGRWYVMRGDEQVSGPHTKHEAQRLAA